jgi:ubiquitin-protein ligase
MDKYPFQPPLVFCKTKIGSPSISDGRDILKELIPTTEWNPKYTIHQII